MIGLADLTTQPFTDPSTLRLISTAYITEPALMPLVEDREDLAILEQLEALTSARHVPRLEIPGGLLQSELLTQAHGYGWTYVNAAFCYTHATGNRFNGPERGAWYGTYGPDAARTAQAEIAWHLSQELIATNVFENISTYRELIAGFTTRFHVLPTEGSEGILADAPQQAYPLGQKIAREILQSGGAGLLYPSVRKPGGQCLVAMRPYLVQNIRQGETWRFIWDGDPSPKIQKLGAKECSDLQS